MLPGIDLLQLLVEVADSGSIAAGARRLGLSASVASRRIAALEEQVGAQLLVRTTRRLRVTEAGSILLAWARSTVSGYREVDDELGALQDSPTGTVRLVCNDYAAANYLPPLLAAFCGRYPGLRLSVSTSTRPEALLDASHDLMLHIGQCPEIDVRARRIWQYGRCLCASPAYLAQFGVPRVVEDLARHRCLVHSDGEGREWGFSVEGRIVRQPIEPYLEVDSYIALFRLAEAGLGIARLSEALLRSAFEQKRLVKLLPEATCVFPNGEVAGMWLLFPQGRVALRTRLLADFLAQAIAGGFTSGFEFAAPSQR